MDIIILFGVVVGIVVSLFGAAAIWDMIGYLVDWYKSGKE